MALRSYEFIPVAQWCRIVERASALNSPNTVFLARPGHAEPVPPPDFAAPDDDVTALGDGSPFGFSMQDGVIAVEPAFLARLDGVLVDKFTTVPVPANTYNLYVAPGLAIAETYGAARATAFLTDRLGEWAPVTHGDATARVKLYDDAGIVDQEIAEPALLLASRFSHGNYFHWMVDVLSRLWALSLFAPGEDIPLVTPCVNLPPYARETLERLGLPNRLIPLNCHRARAERLYVPSFFAPGGYSRAQATWLSAMLRRAFGVDQRAGRKRLYVSRSDARARRVANEDAVLAMLRPLGFEAVTLGGLTVQRQAELFAEAEVVVAPHGAGNTNMLFAAPGATLIELVPATTPQPCYWMLTKLAGQRYGRLVDPAPQNGEATMVFDLSQLRAILDMVLDQPAGVLR